MLVDTEKDWYLVQFKPNSHQLAKRNLERQGFKVFLPMQEITRRKTSSFTNYLRPLFPGYMFISLRPESSPWQKINSTVGITKLVALNHKPSIVPLDLISSLASRCDVNGKLKHLQDFERGDNVKVIAGPFADFSATVEKFKGEERVFILLNLMGQETRVTAKTQQLAKMT